MGAPLEIALSRAIDDLRFGHQQSNSSSSTQCQGTTATSGFSEGLDGGNSTNAWVHLSENLTIKMIILIILN